MDVVRYVIVVHGIGQQRKNESVRPVIQRFAEARSVSGRQLGDPITLGLLASHLREAPSGEFTDALEEGWVEFDGIPLRLDDESGTPFVGRHSRQPGSNLRFVDLHWSSVMDDQLEAFGEPVAAWTRALIDRLEIRDAPPWVRHLLHTMRNGLIPLQKILHRRDPKMAEEIFDRFLGDVQLYGEYQATRGMGVRRFHERLAKLETDHYAAEEKTGRVPREPRYLVIGHSLGSVLSFDALLFAYLRRSGDHQNALELLPEYNRNPSTKEQDEQFPNLEWIRNVDAFVTLGSPIDKFLTLWWLNYEHLVTPNDWVDLDLLRSRENATGKIAHYNYCDEQDPVGDNLDVAYSEGTLVGRVFEKKEDVVFTRYPLPGVAHVGYWTDADLFRRILDQAIDGRADGDATPVAWFKLWTYVQSLAWTYVAIPLLGWIVATATMVWALRTADENWKTRVFWILVSLVVLRYTCWVMQLMVEWREIVITKGRDMVTFLSSRQRRLREVALWIFRACVVVLPAVWLYLLIASVAEVPRLGMTESASHWRQVIQNGTSWLWQPVAGIWNAIAGAISKVFTWTHLSTVFAWAPVANLRADLKEAWPILALVASAYGFAIGFWNLLVFSRVRWRYRHRSLALKFVDYVNNDPTRPTRGTDG